MILYVCCCRPGVSRSTRSTATSSCARRTCCRCPTCRRTRASACSSPSTSRSPTCSRSASRPPCSTLAVKVNYLCSMITVMWLKDPFSISQLLLWSSCPISRQTFKYTNNEHQKRPNPEQLFYLTITQITVV